ncbi:MAG: ABC transporter permease, partial [Clostridia bacterium]|nr:ABC transporter permease [Clostridia bacterium]
MVRYVLQRLGQTLLVLLIVSLLTYLLVDFLPGDPIAAMTGGEISGETYERLYYEMNMDKPVFVRYALWLRDALTGNLGTSASYHRKVVDIIAERVPVTIYLSLLAFLISVPLDILCGIVSAVRRGSAADTAVTLTANVGSCLPQFWLGILFMYIFSMQLGWLPSSGFVWPHENFVLSLRQTFMPLLCLAIG